MTPFEIALAVRNKPDDGESIIEFALRTMSGEHKSTFRAALDLLKAWERAQQDIEKVFGILQSVGSADTTIGTLIKHKRRLGYDSALESLLARRWCCPHCKQWATIEKVALPIGDPTRLPCCVACGEEGIAPVQPTARLDVCDGGKSGLRPIQGGANA